MKKFLNKNVCVLLIISQLLSSCLATRALWNGGSPSSKYDGIKSFFIDKSGKRVVLIGVGNFKHMNDHYHYSLEDPEGKLLRVFELGVRSEPKDLDIYFSRLEAKGSEIYKGWGWFGYELKTNKISKEEEQFLRENNFVVQGNNTSREFVHYDFVFNKKNMLTRYPSSQETITNFCPEANNSINQEFNNQDNSGIKIIQGDKNPNNLSNPNSQSPNCTKIIKFSKPWQGVIWEEYTTSQKATRAVVTPFTVALDTLLLPIIVPLFVYSLYQQSTTNYWCQGEFCGYDNKQGNQTSATNTKPTTTSKPTSKTKPDSNQNLNQNLNQKQN